MLSSWSSTTRMRARSSARGASATVGPGAGRGSVLVCTGTAASATAVACPACSAGILCGVLAEEALDLGDDGAWLARLGQIAVASHLHRLLPIRREGVRRQRDDRDVARHGIVLEHLRRFPAVDDRDGDVHEDQVGLLGARLGYSLFAVQRFAHFVAEVP